jgi:hypothetical protein
MAAAILDFATKAKSKTLSLLTGSPTAAPRIITPTPLKPLCNYDINDIIKANDPRKLKDIIDKILKKMNLDLESEYLEFQIKVIQTLENHFSVFMQFQSMVIEELNKIGIPQIQEVSLDYYQLLNEAEVKDDINELKQNILDEQLV